MVAIVDYGVGNLFSLRSSFACIGAESVVSGDPEVLKKADKIILPGVGAFGDAAAKLRREGLDSLICEMAEAGKPLMGICLGMQMLFDRSLEYGEHDGLGLIPGVVRPISEMIPADLKIPHIGWNGLVFPQVKAKDELFDYINEGDHVYFVHSFAATDCDASVIARAEYGAMLTAAVRRDNVWGCQFHPEKSGKVGLNILKAFCREGA